MLKLSTKTLSVAAAFALVTNGAMAQTAVSQPTKATTTTNIGVSPKDAQKALQKAKPQADTGTLVRTEPSAAERARQVTDDGKAKLPKAPVVTHTPAAAHQPSNVHPNQPSNAMPGPGDTKSQQTTGTVTNTTTPSAAMGITGTMPGAAPSNANATNTRDNADKGHDPAAPMDTMGNRSNNVPAKK